MNGQSYEPPQLQDIGTLHELTMQDKELGATDGFTFQGADIRNAS